MGGNFTQVCNTFLEALSRVRICPTEHSVMLALIRKLDGWHREEDCISLSQIADATGMHKPQAHKALKALEARNMVKVRREGKGRGTKSYIAIVKNPEEWKTLKGNTCLNDNDEDKGNKRHNLIGNTSHNDNPSEKVIHLVTTKESTNKRNKGVYGPLFEDFWKAYPRKLEKQRAYRCWNARLKEGASPDDLIRASANYATSVKDRNPDYVKLPVTFLGPDRPFEDYVDWRPPKYKCINAAMHKRGRSIGSLERCGCEECMEELERRQREQGVESG